jgi:hypothetical protein
MKKAIFEYNSGNLALLCSKCRKIIKVGYEFTPHELECFNTNGSDPKYYLSPQYCDKHKK